MVTKILNFRSVQWGISALIILGTLVCIFTPNYFLFKKGANFAIQIMLSNLFLGILFLVFRQPRLMFTSFACCAGLCMFLKYTSDADLIIPTRTSELVVNAAHINLSSSNENYENTINSILSTNADLISIQEVTPDWDEQLKVALSEKYPYQSSLVRFDPFGLAIYSKYPLQTSDTFYYNEIPNLIGSFKPEGYDRKIYFISSHTTPPLYSAAYDQLKEHLEQIGDYAKRINAPVLTFGDYNAPPWWTEIQNLKDEGRLFDSRRSGIVDLNSVFQNPTDYIMHSGHLKCVDFESINSKSSSHMGIRGTFQFNPEYFNAQASLQ